MLHPIAPFGLRLPANLRAWLKQRAEANHRSMNSEIIAILEQALLAKQETADV